MDQSIRYTIKKEKLNDSKVFNNSISIVKGIGHNKTLGNIYLYHSKNLANLKFVFKESEDLNTLANDNQYVLIAKKSGKKEDLTIIRQALSELGHKPIDGDCLYNNSDRLLRYILYLGLSLTNSKKKRTILKKFHNND